MTEKKELIFFLLLTRVYLEATVEEAGAAIFLLGLGTVPSRKPFLKRNQINLIEHNLDINTSFNQGKFYQSELVNG